MPFPTLGVMPRQRCMPRAVDPNPHRMWHALQCLFNVTKASQNSAMLQCAWKMSGATCDAVAHVGACGLAVVQGR